MLSVSWLLFVYKVPSEPSARRVYVWRKLRRLGAILIHDAVWVLPANARTREQLQWLAAEIADLEGEAFLWESALIMIGREDALIEQFMEQVQAEYRGIITEMEGDTTDLTALSRRYQQAKTMDYFESELGKRVREALIAARGGQEP